MAYGNPGNPGPKEDFYSDAPEGAPPESEKEEGAEGAGKSYVLPKEILMGKEFKPGDEVVLKIRAIHGDQIEVEYATEEGKEEDHPEPHAPGAYGEEGEGGGRGEMASMME